MESCNASDIGITTDLPRSRQAYLPACIDPPASIYPARPPQRATEPGKSPGPNRDAASRRRAALPPKALARAPRPRAMNSKAKLESESTGPGVDRGSAHPLASRTPD